jgi:hypothetical protein
MNAAWGQLAALPEAPSQESLKERQDRWFRSFMARSANTAFGRAHGWSADQTLASFRHATPLRTYEAHLPWMHRIRSGESDVLFPGRPIGYEFTGGSSGGSKCIPYSAEGLADFQKVLRPWLGRTVRDFGLREGRAYVVTSPALRAEPGLPDGAYLGEDLGEALLAISALPRWIPSLQHIASWHLATLHALVRCEDLAFLSLWSPTLYLGFLDALRRDERELDCALRAGIDIEGHHLPPDLEALRRLQAYRVSGDTRALWPHLRLISAWEDGASGPFAKALKSHFPHTAFEGKGLLATEGVVTTPYVGGAPLLAADSALFEFLEPDGSAKWAHELSLGVTYEVVLTTASGLMRYRTGDAVRCEGHHGDVPRLRFLGRLGLTSDLVGEKLTEAFVAQCLHDLPGFRMLIPQTAPRPRYLLVTDREVDAAQLARLEHRLARNPQYAHAQRMGQLGPLMTFALKEPLARFTARRLKEGARPGDLKVPALLRELDWADTFGMESF